MFEDDLLFDGTRTVTPPTAVLWGAQLPVGTVPGRAKPEGRAVLDAAARTGAVPVRGGVATLMVEMVSARVERREDAHARNEGGQDTQWADQARVVFHPLLEWSADGTDWRVVADPGPMYHGIESRTVGLEPGLVRLVEAVGGGASAEVTYRAVLRRSVVALAG